MYTSLHWAEGRLCQEKYTGACTKQRGPGEPRDPHRSLQLASFGLQHRVRPGAEALWKTLGRHRGLATVRMCWGATSTWLCEIDVSITAKAERAAQSHTEPIDTPNKTFYWTLCCPSKRQDPAPLTRTQAQVPLTRKPSQNTSPTPFTGQTPKLRTMI